MANNQVNYRLQYSTDGGSTWNYLNGMNYWFSKVGSYFTPYGSINCIQNWQSNRRRLECTNGDGVAFQVALNTNWSKNGVTLPKTVHTIPATGNYYIDLGNTDGGHSIYAYFDYSVSQYLSYDLNVTSPDSSVTASPVSLPYNGSAGASQFSQEFTFSSQSQIIKLMRGAEVVQRKPGPYSVTLQSSLDNFDYTVVGDDPDYSDTLLVMAIDGSGQAFKAGEITIQSGIHHFEGYDTGSDWAGGWSAILVRSSDGKALPPGYEIYGQYNSVVETIPPSYQVVTTQKVTTQEGSGRVAPIFVGTQVFPRTAPAFDIVISGNQTAPTQGGFVDGVISPSTDTTAWGVDDSSPVADYSAEWVAPSVDPQGLFEDLNYEATTWGTIPESVIDGSIQPGTPPDTLSPNSEVCPCSPWYANLADMVKYLASVQSAGNQAISTVLAEGLNSLVNGLSTLNENFYNIKTDITGICQTLSEMKDQIAEIKDGIVDVVEEIGSIGDCLHFDENGDTVTVAESLDAVADSLTYFDGQEQKTIAQSAAGVDAAVSDPMGLIRQDIISESDSDSGSLRVYTKFRGE